MTDNEVRLAVLLKRTNSSLNQALFALTTGVIVTPPVPPVLLTTVNETLVVRVIVPLVPVTVTVAGPVVAVLEAVNVSVLLLAVVVAGLKAAVTPAGNALALNVTLEVKLVLAMPITLVAEPPRVTDTVAGLGESVKFCDGFTVRLIAAVRVNVPLVAVTVTVAGPVVAVPEAVKVRTLLLPVVDDGANAAVTPVGKLLVLKVTLPVKFVRVRLIALVAEPPRVTDTFAGLVARLKPAVVAGPCRLLKIASAALPLGL